MNKETGLWQILPANMKWRIIHVTGICIEACWSLRIRIPVGIRAFKLGVPLADGGGGEHSQASTGIQAAKSAGIEEEPRHNCSC